MATIVQRLIKSISTTLFNGCAYQLASQPQILEMTGRSFAQSTAAATERALNLHWFNVLVGLLSGEGPNFYLYIYSNN